MSARPHTPPPTSHPQLINLRNHQRPSLLGPLELLFSPYNRLNKANMLTVRSRDAHRALKGAWQPMFFSSSLDGFRPMMVEGADMLCARLEAAAAAGAEVDVWRLLGAMTMDVVQRAAFG